jgi:hypothetical protein
MFYGFVMAIAVVAPISYLMWCDIKSHNKIKYLEEQLTVLSNKIKQHDDEFVFVKNSSKAELCYKILKDQCKRMGTCGMFK